MSIFTRRRRAANFAGLLAGFGFGQGSLFLAQTWLLASGQIRFMGQFSFAFTMVILAYQAIDLGGLVILSRHVAGDDHGEHHFPTFYWSFSALRLAIALLLAIGSIVWAALQPASFGSSYAVAAAAGLVLFSLNPGGVLDGHNMSGWSGGTWALPFVASTIALPFSTHLVPASAGLVLGAALSIGAVLAVAAQYAVLHWHGIHLPWSRPSRAAMREGGREGLLYMVGWLPGQLYFRGQTGIAMALLGPIPTALFIYAKQLIMSATRFLYFARRVEYPNLVRQLADPRRLVWKVLTIQKVSLWMGAFGTLAFAALGLSLHLAFPHKLRGAGLVIAMFAPIILTASVNATFMQACYAMKRTDTSAWTAVLITVAGLALQAALVPIMGMPGIALAEALVHTMGVALIVMSLSDRYKRKAIRGTVF